jgi:hypothetical protein
VLETLAKIFAWQQNDDERLVISQAQSLVAGHKIVSRTDVRDPVGALPTALVDGLFESNRQAVAIWTELAPVCALFYRIADAEKAMVRANKLDIKQAPIVLAHARSLGVQPTLYRAPNDVCDSYGESLIVGPWAFAPLSARDRVRLITTLLGMRQKSAPLERLSEEELRLFVTAAARLAKLPAAPPSLSMLWAQAEPLSKRLDDAIGRKERKVLGNLGAHLGELDALIALRQSWRAAAAKVALVMNADLLSVTEHFGLTTPDTRRDLIVWSVSAPFVNLRRELGKNG